MYTKWLPQQLSKLPGGQGARLAPWPATISNNDSLNKHIKDI